MPVLIPEFTDGNNVLVPTNTIEAPDVIKRTEIVRVQSAEFSHYLEIKDKVRVPIYSWKKKMTCRVDIQSPIDTINDLKCGMIRESDSSKYHRFPDGKSSGSHC